MNLVFERLKEEELEDVALLYDSEVDRITNRNKMKQTFNLLKSNKDYCMITAKIDGQVVGFAKAIINHDLFEENNNFMTLWSVRVKKEFRRKGIGTKLFKYIETMAKEYNCDFICLIANKKNKGANAFYQKIGYDRENGYVKFLAQ